MPKYTRGEFLGFGAVLAGAVGLRMPGRPAAAPETAALAGTTAAQPTADAASGSKPDMVVVNARIYTIDPAQPQAEAFAIKNGRFIAVGSTADIRNLAAGGVPT